VENLSQQFQQQFGYPQLPTQELLDQQKQERAQVMQQEAKSKRLEEQMSQAVALRDTPTNGGSILSALGSLGQFAGGDANVRRTQGRQERNDSALANSMAAAQEAGIQKGLRDEGSALANSVEAWDSKNKDRDEKGEDRRSREKIALQKINAASRKAINDRDAPGIFFLEDDAAGTPIKGNHRPDLGGYLGVDGQVYPYEQVRSEGPQEITDKFDRNVAATAKQYLKTNYKFMDMSTEDWDKVSSPMEGLPTETFQDFFINGEKAGILEWAEKHGMLPGSIDREALNKSIGVFNEMRTHVIMPYREDTTSGQLSDRDVEEFNRNILMQRGATGQALFDSAQSLLGHREQHLRSRLQGWQQYGDNGAYTRSKDGYNQLRNEGWQEQQAKARSLKKDQDFSATEGNSFDADTFNQAKEMLGYDRLDEEKRKRFENYVRIHTPAYEQSMKQRGGLTVDGVNSPIGGM
jgi:hypothetical protein